MVQLQVRVVRSGKNFQIMSFNEEVEVFYYYGYLTALKHKSNLYRSSERISKVQKENNFHLGEKVLPKDLESKFDSIINRLVFKNVNSLIKSCSPLNRNLQIKI